MADQKITQLNPLLAADAQATVDVLPVADVSTAETKKITLADAVTSGIGSIADNTVPGAKLQSGTVTATQIGTGEVGTAQLADSGVTTAKINAAAVTTAKIATDAVTATQIAANAVGSSELADNAVDTAAIQDNAVTTAKIADGAVTAAKIAAGVLSGNQITNGSVDTLQLAPEAVTTEKIANNAVTTAKIATGAVGSGNLAADAVVTAKILNSNVTTAKIADDAVTSAKIATGAVGTTEIADSSVTTSKINAGAVTTATIAADAVTATEIADNAVVTAGIADAAVTTAKIADANVTTAKIADNAITTAKIATGAVGASEITDGSITSVELTDGAVTTTKIADDAVTAAKIAAGGVDTTALGAAAVTAAKIADGTITAAKLANDLDGSEFLPKVANTFLAGPTTGTDAVPTFRALTSADLPVIASGDLPVATAGSVGAVSPGTGLTVNGSGALSIDNTVTGGTFTKVTVNSSGVVTAGANIAESDVPSLSASKITSGTFGSAYIANSAVTGVKIADEATVQFGGSGSTSGVVTFPNADFKGQYFFDELNSDLYIWSGSAWLPVTIISGELVYAGTYDASTNLVASVTSAGSAAGLTVGAALPAAASTNNRYYLVVSDSGTGSGNAPAEALAPPDMILSNGATWDLIDVSNAIAGQTAANISFTPYGDIVATNVQTAIQELDTEKLPTSGGTLTGSLTVGAGASLVFEGSTADDYETTFAVVDPTADRTITFPDASGTVITTGSSGDVTSAMIADGTIVNGDISASAGIAFSKLATLTSGNIIVGNSGNVATGVAVTGDVTISNTGVTAISSGAIVNADINASAAIAYSKLAPLTSGNIIIGSGGNVATGVAVTGDITISNAGVTAIAAGAVVDADISASAEIAVSKLADGTARQLLQTDAAGTGVEWTSNVDIPGTLDVTGAAVFDSTITAAGNVTLNAQADLRFADANSSNWVALQAPTTVAANVTWTLPATDGSSGQVLSTNGSGVLSWATSSASIADGDKGDITVSGSGNTWTIDSGVVDTSNLGGDITTAGKALLDDADAAAQRTTLGLGTLATQDGTFSGTSSGTNTGDQTITLTGDVTGSGTGSFAATIANDAVTYAKIQNVSATDRLLGRSTAGSGNVEEIVCTAAGRALLDDATAAAQRTTLGLVIGTDVQAYDADTAKYDDTTANFTGTLQNAGSNVVVDSDIGVTVQAYDADTAKYDDITANFTGTLQNGGSNVIVDSDIGVTVQAYDADTAKYDDITANFTGTLQNGGSNVIVDSDIGSTVQAYDADTAKYDDATANFTGTLQNGGSNVIVDSDIGSTVQAYDADTAKYDDTTANFTGTLQNNGSNVVVDSDIGSTVQAYDADTAKLDVAQTFTAVQTLTDPAIVGTILEDVYTITDGAAFEVDPGNGSVQLITLGANRTPKATNFAAGEAVTLMVADGTAYTLTWTDTTWGTSGVVWTGGVAPTLATSGYTVIQFWKVGSQVYGATVGDVA